MNGRRADPKEPLHVDFSRRSAEHQCVGVDKREILPLSRCARSRISWPHDRLTALLGGGKHAARKLKRAQILLAADAGVGDAAIAWISLPTSTAASTLLRKRMNS